MSEAREPVIPVGQHTLRLAARTLEQTLAGLWQGIVESHGHDPAEGWEVVLQGATLRRKAPETAAPPEGGSADGAVRPGAPAAGAPA